MTQVELPQLSLQRYVDLVKRRRWQLLPVSLLGLLVGALVAFAIPRYYVAETSFEHQLVQGEFGRDEDPFRKIVNSAKMTIPLVAGKAMESLRWPEMLVADPSERTLFEKEVRTRIDVLDSNAQEKDRAIAHIRILYRDTDAGRAAGLANALFDTWSKERVELLRTSHEKERERATQDFTAADRTYDKLLEEKRDLEWQYRIQPDRDLAVQRQEGREKQAEQQRQRELLFGKETARDALADEIRRAQERIRTMPERVTPNLMELLVAAKDNKEAQGMLVLWQLAKADLVNLHEGTRSRALQERAVRLQEEQLMRMLAVDMDAEGKVANREYALLAAKLVADAEALARLEIEVKRLQAELAAQQQAFENLVEGWRRYELNQKALTSAADARKDAELRQKTQSGYLAALEQRLPVQRLQPAYAPPHPTDPNILVVALIGAVLGLGVAIGLILLLDLLQGSFKTIGDVERGLGVPVLGGMSHLETEEERTQVQRGRRRAATVAFGFVALVVVVVTIYYRAPTRLPAIVRELLQMLLGT